MPTYSQALKRRIEAAQGKQPCDWILKDATWLDVYSCEWRTGDIAIVDEFVVATDPGLKGLREMNCRGKWVVPGFIDAHVHLESSLMVPGHFQDAVLGRGTTSAICDPHELANVLGVPGIQYFLDASEQLDLSLRVMLSSCVPATAMETNGGGVIQVQALLPLAKHANALGLAEMMNVPGVLHGDDSVLEKLEAFSHGPIDGHCPLLRGRELSAYAASGISSCHESSELEEAREKLIKGISVWIREGSVARDLDALSPLLTLATSTSIGFCTDDRNPLDIETQGHIDHLVRGAIRNGVAPEVAYRAASWSVARHYGLSSGRKRVGSIAPGYVADLVVLNDARACDVLAVMKSGVLSSELSRRGSRSSTDTARNTVHAKTPAATDLAGPEGQVHVIDVLPGKIITGRLIQAHDAPGVCRLSVLERHGKALPPANAYVRGFGALKGAIASSVGHDSHNLIVVGDNVRDMRVALASLIESGGGFAVAKEGEIIARLELPIGGLMSTLSPQEISLRLKRLKTASHAIGCELEEPFLQLAFLSLPVIPSLKLTDRGLVDVDRFEIISVRAS